MILTEKADAFIGYAKKKGWDCSLIIYDGHYMAILNPDKVNHAYIGESPLDTGSMNEAIELCKIEMLKKVKK